MTSLRPNPMVTLAVFLLLLLAACSGVDDEIAVPTTSPLTTEASTTSSTVAERSAEQVAIDQFDVTMAQLGVRDLAGVSDCVLERLESEGFGLIGEEAAPLAALVGCEPAVSATLFGDQSATFGDETWTCARDELAKWVGEVPLADAESFFSAPTPPDELITIISETCGIAEDDFRAIFN